MQFPLTLGDFRLLVAFNAIMLLLLAEVLFSRNRTMLEKRRLRAIAVTLSMIFLATVLMLIYEAW